MTMFKSSSGLPHPVITTVIRVGDVCYLVSEDCYTSFTSSIADDDEFHNATSTPVTVINLQNEQVINSLWLEEKVTGFLEADDVFHEGFLTRVLLKGCDIKLRPSMTDSAKAVLARWGSTAHFIESEANIPSGPYVIPPSRTPRLCQVFKLYPDPQLAFIYGLVPSVDKQRFQSYLGLIPVPSRLYSEPPSDSLPLSGIRIAIKDVFDIAGTTTSAGVRAFDGFYGVSQSTAPAIQQLISKGAMIVGKTKTVQFVSGENPLDWIDYHCPFNPRGDGYLTAAGSSTGSAAGLAAYDWLDIAIGTDTFGSIIVPASWQGLYGIRPTHGLLDHGGMIPLSGLFDTPGYFSRDINEFGAFGKAWYGEKYSSEKLKSLANIFYLPNRFEIFPEEKVTLMDRFINDLAKGTDSQRRNIDIAALWKETSSEGNVAIDEFLATTLAHIQLYDCYHNNKKFREDYKDQHGREPYVDPMIRFKCPLKQNFGELGSQLTKADYDKACKEKNVFMSFVREQIVKDDSILVLPMGKAQAQYRDEYLGSPEQNGRNLQGFGFGNNAFTVLAGLPAINVPVAQLPIKSRATQGIINEPISVMLVGPPSSDGWLINVIKETLVSAGRPLSVHTGPDMFTKEDKIPNGVY